MLKRWLVAADIYGIAVVRFASLQHVIGVLTPVAVFCLPFAPLFFGNKINSTLSPLAVAGSQTQHKSGFLSSNLSIYVSIGQIMCVSRVLWCICFAPESIVKTINIEAQQSVLIHLDARGQYIEFDCFVKRETNSLDYQFQHSAETCKVAAFALSFAATALHFQVGWALAFRIITGSSMAFLLAALGQQIDNFAQVSGETDADVFIGDVQRQYIRRRCRSTETVPFINRSDVPVEVCISFAAHGFLSHTQDVEILCDVLESNEASLMNVFESEVSPHMKQLLSKSTAAYRRRRWVAPAILNVCVGAAAYGVLLALPFLCRDIYRVYGSVDYRSCVGHVSLASWLHSAAGEQRMQAFFACVQSTRPVFNSLSVCCVHAMRSVTKISEIVKVPATSLFANVSTENSTAAFLPSLTSPVSSTPIGGDSAVTTSSSSVHAAATSLEPTQSPTNVVPHNHLNGTGRSEVGVVATLWEMMQGWKTWFFTRRASELLGSIVGEDTLQQLNLKKLDESRSDFIQSFLGAARPEHFRSLKDVEKFIAIKKQLEEWCRVHDANSLRRISEHSSLRSMMAVDEESLFKDLEQIWSVWSDTAGQLHFSNAISWVAINFYSAMVSKNEVNFRFVLL